MNIKTLAPILAVLGTGIVIGTVVLYPKYKEIQSPKKEEQNVSEQISNTDNLATITPTPTSNPTPTPTKAVKPTRKIPPALKVKETQYVKVTYPITWSLSMDGDTIILTQNGLRITINPNFYQVSGVDGARFGEVAHGLKSVALVCKFTPEVECGSRIEKATIQHAPTYDYVISKNDTHSGDSGVCDYPTDGKRHWYLRIYANYGYLLNLDSFATVTNKPENRTAYITVSWDKASKINDLPDYDDSAFQNRLKDVDDIVEHIEFK